MTNKNRNADNGADVDGHGHRFEKEEKGQQQQQQSQPGKQSYSISSSPLANDAICQLSESLCNSSSRSSRRRQTVRLISMMEHFDKQLLTRFYEKLMIPNFPLEDERDDLNDWLYCFHIQSQLPQQSSSSLSSNNAINKGPIMDVLILVLEEGEEDEDDDKGLSNDDDDIQSENEEEKENPLVTVTSKTTTTTSTAIVGGIAIEYYQQAQVGLLSYVVVDEEFRRNGIIKILHPVAYDAIQQLHRHRQRCWRQQNEDTSSTDSDGNDHALMFAETNTIDAGDVSPEMIQQRHGVLKKLGYQHIQFPYVQPPLVDDGDSFDDIMLLLYCGKNKNDDGDGDSDNGRTSKKVASTTNDRRNYMAQQTESTVSSSSPSSSSSLASLPSSSTTSSIDSAILFNYVVDFYQSVMGYDDGDDDDCAPEYKNHWYYKLLVWYCNQNPTTTISPDLPWNDVTNELRRQYQVEQQKQQLQQ
jgi:hypothetical protein